jgi:hypothetical protein
VREVHSRDPEAFVTPRRRDLRHYPPTPPDDCLARLNWRFYLGHRIRAREIVECDELVRSNGVYEEIIAGELETIVGEVRVRSGCGEIRTLPLPVLFAPRRTRPEYGGADIALAITPNPINLLVVDPGLVIVSAQGQTDLEAEIAAELATIGIQPVFVDSPRQKTPTTPTSEYGPGDPPCTFNPGDSPRPRMTDRGENLHPSCGPRPAFSG